MDHPATMAMSDAEMAKQAAGWFAAHPAHGASTTIAPVDSFIASGTTFNADGNTGTNPDTVFIHPGDVILFKWQSGSHTVTSGSGSTDPNAGTLFDVPLNSSAKTFSFQFNSIGVVPFFCRFHESSGMTGAVVVRAPAAVQPVAHAADGLGFVRAPAPNPTGGSSTFSFALTRPGRARAIVLDVAGRRVASVFDQDFPAGTFRATWDGRGAAGGRAAAGVYALRLEVPGAVQVRTLTVVR